MALIVQKYGGTSVGSPDRIKNVAKRVAKFKAQGHDIVVVLSAMSGETNRLIALAKEIGSQTIRLRTAKGNNAAQKLYHKMGFVREDYLYSYDLTI